MKKHIKTTSKILTLFFAFIGMLFTAVFIGMQFGLFNVQGSISDRNNFFTNGTTTPELPEDPCTDKNKTICAWNETPQWEVIKGGLTKDQKVITRVSVETGIPARLIASIVLPEQTRFFTSEREVFKRYFEPLKILGSLSQFSLGVSGIKQETAVQIEKYASNPTSPFYPGETIASLIAYKEGADHDKELFNRLTDAKNHYYSYLYTAIFIKEIEAQWQHAGFDISNNPGVIITLFNLGFQKSKPNQNPNIGGAGIKTGGKVYPYGELGAIFYTSSELVDTFPR